MRYDASFKLKVVEMAKGTNNCEAPGSTGSIKNKSVNGGSLKQYGSNCHEKNVPFVERIVNGQN